MKNINDIIQELTIELSNAHLAGNYRIAKSIAYTIEKMKEARRSYDSVVNFIHY